MRVIDTTNIWRNWWALVLLAAVLSPITFAHAQVTSAATAENGSVLTHWRDDVLDSRWETGITAGGLTVLGVRSWEWGSAKRFKFNSEGWFSKDHGFAREDVVVNLLGTGLAYARAVNPQLRDTLDFRKESKPRATRALGPFLTTHVQKFLLAFKVGGLPSMRDTPWRYLELQAGYYTRGFSRAEQIDGLGRSRHTFVGVGLNLNELLLGRRPSESEAELKRATRLFFEHIQLPILQLAPAVLTDQLKLAEKSKC